MGGARLPAPFSPERSYQSGVFTLENRSGLPDGEVRELVAYGAGPVGLAGVHVVVRAGARRMGWRGRAFRRLPAGQWPEGTEYLISISLNRGRDFASGDWRQWLVEGAAHEAKHVEQYREGRHHGLGRAMARRLEHESRDYQESRRSAYLLGLG